LISNQKKPNEADAQKAAAIADLWARLTDEADGDNEAKVYLLMFGPWASEQVCQAPNS